MDDNDMALNQGASRHRADNAQSVLLPNCFRPSCQCPTQTSRFLSPQKTGHQRAYKGLYFRILSQNYQEKTGKMRKSLWITVALFVVVVAPAVLRADDITYTVNQPVGPGSVTGFITTDGTIGTLSIT